MRCAGMFTLNQDIKLLSVSEISYSNLIPRVEVLDNGMALPP